MASLANIEICDGMLAISIAISHVPDGVLAIFTLLKVSSANLAGGSLSLIYLRHNGQNSGMGKIDRTKSSHRVYSTHSRLRIVVTRSICREIRMSVR